MIYSTAIDQFRTAIGDAGLTVPTEIFDDGVIHRFSTNAKPSHKNGWYILHTDGIAAGAFGDWREGFTQNWCGRTNTSMSEVERLRHRDRVKGMQIQREADLTQRNEAAALDALKRWNSAATCTEHCYLNRKGIQPCGTKIEAGNLLISMRDTKGSLHSLQTIASDGAKMFMAGGRVKGCYFAIGKIKEVLIVCEGFATGASIYECTGHAVAVAFNAGNLGPVAMAMRDKYPTLKIIVAADDDQQTLGNPGMTKAIEAAKFSGAHLAVPVFKAVTG
jgi:putative DNA primase/helicase